ncbi:MAG TPA: hypothetical protein VJ810_36800 [Blastocatellia bacterium]|nr:hypothetical protein [Blastocatellia bacterium]
MISTARLTVPAGILRLIILIPCFLTAQTLFASRHVHYAQYRSDKPAAQPAQATSVRAASPQSLEMSFNLY